MDGDLRNARLNFRRQEENHIKDIVMKMEWSEMEAIINTIAFSLFRYIKPALLP